MRSTSAALSLLKNVCNAICYLPRGSGIKQRMNGYGPVTYNAAQIHTRMQYAPAWHRTCEGGRGISQLFQLGI